MVGKNLTVYYEWVDDSSRLVFHDPRLVPLADRMRPRTLDEVVGQEHLLREGSPLRQFASPENRSVGFSLVLYGPAGVGKTTLAQVIARSSGFRFVELSAVTSGVKQVREVIDRALKDRDLSGVVTVLFLDEIHRFTKAQQDLLLPAVERGWVRLIAATTENPAFSVITPLLSRSLLLTLQPLSDENVGTIVDRAIVDERGFGGELAISREARGAIVLLAAGDGRKALTVLEAAAAAAFARARRGGSVLGEEAGDRCETVGEIASEGVQAGEEDACSPGERVADTSGQSNTAAATITLEDVQQAADRAVVHYDKNADQHYDVISAFIKSIRGSDADAALHYLARMIEGGEDPRFIARRLIVHAAEDIGLADPNALNIAVSAAQAAQLVGLPEARIPLAEATIYLATAPKSNAVLRGIDAAIADVRAGRSGQVPLHLRDGHSRATELLGNGKGYVYPHDFPVPIVAQQYLPDTLAGVQYYAPSEQGRERAIAERVQMIRELLGGRAGRAGEGPAGPVGRANTGTET